MIARPLYQHNELRAAPLQKPYWLQVRAPQQSQSDMQVEAAAVLRECVSMRGQKVFKKFFKIARAQKKTRAAHPLPSLMTNVLPALPHARRSARGVPMNAEPDAEAAWVFASTWKTAEGLELGI